MKSEKIIRAIGGIDEDIIEAADLVKLSKINRTPRIKFAAAAAALVLVAAGAFTIPGLLGQSGTVTDSGAPGIVDESNGTGELHVEMFYNYAIDDGRYSTYVRGRVIESAKIGQKLEDVTVTAGYFDADGKRLSEEHARAEVFEIYGVSSDVAVALRFLDKLEAALTTRFYVAMNPEADLTPVRDYIIITDAPDIYDGEGVPE